MPTCGQLFEGVVAIFLPPLAVFFERSCGSDLIINVCLTILGWIPGMIHAWYLIFYKRF